MAAQKRKLVPGAEGAQMLCLGAMPGRGYEPPEFTKLGAPAPQPPQYPHSRIQGDIGRPKTCRVHA